MASEIIAYVTAIGEPTTDLCIWTLSRNGFGTILIDEPTTSLAKKLQLIYDHADADFLRVDADVVFNRSFTPELIGKLAQDPIIWWWQFVTFDWFKCDINYSGAFIKKEAIAILREHIDKHLRSTRPETMMSRLDEFFNPRRFATYDKQIVGLHGYRGDIKRVKRQKMVRGQSHNYDFKLAERLNKL